VGIAVLCLAVIRVILRSPARGGPGHEPPLGLLKVAHGAFYLLFFAMPISGALAYYGGVEAAGGPRGSDEAHVGPDHRACGRGSRPPVRLKTPVAQHDKG
jgi:hypothetical protein